MKSIRVSRDIVPMSRFKAEAAEWIRRIADSGQPLVITQNGKAAGVLLSPATFDELTERLAFTEAVEEGLEDARQGKTLDHELLVAEVRARYGRDTEDG
jgi:prevent-host-death family protein